ncbi:polysaccharide biosynthesis protein [Brevibacterium album]|uniref:polysaccharide biosynthesis protein n=1 Tax=Brevibacterium album TaxID=417948 RepID=UPI00068490BB|nr:polysaccharide biosynthesis protein [Brevibacterium album]
MRAVLRAMRDGIIFALCVWGAALARYDFSLSEPSYPAIAVCSAIGFLVFTVFGTALVYRGRYYRGSGDEYIGIGALLAVSSGLMYLLGAFGPEFLRIPSSVPLTSSALAVVVIGLVGWTRSTLHNLSRSRSGRSRRTLIVGAGYHGLAAFRMMADDPHAEHVAVGFLDDDPEKSYLRIEGVRVLGTLADLPTVLEARMVDTVVLASHSLPTEKLDAIVEATRRRAVELKVLPELDALDLRERGAASHSAVALRPTSFRSVEMDDLIGRRPISTDIEEIASYLDGKTVLVTGAGGSIGSHLCKQLARFSPARVVMTDRDESGLHSTQLILEGSAMLTSEDLVLGDLRDSGFVRSLMAEVKPDIVFHAAALKHLTFLERFPDEAIKTNVGASLSLMDAAVEQGVRQLIHISTDKAADPTSVLGASKYLTERTVAALAAETGLGFMSVRFGNVLGSRGSVLGSFVAQAQAGGPLTVTAPEVRRYFMSADEACELVMQAGAIGRAGETLVLDMGEPVSIEALARRVIALSGRDDIEIEYTGLRAGEKLEEARLAAGEEDLRPRHPLITQVPIAAVSLAGVRALVVSARQAGHRRDAELVAALRRMIAAPSPEADAGSRGATGGPAVAERAAAGPATAPLSLPRILDGSQKDGSL